MPTVQVKRGLAAALAAVNPTPLAGEIVWVSDTNTLVVGNGSSAYSSLSVISATPTSHTHGNITNAGAIGSTANLPVITTTSGVLTTGTFGTSANTFCAGNDARLSDSRTPTGAAGGDLTGTYPNPTIAAGAIVTADLANDAVTYAKIQNVSATDRLLGRSSAGAGDVEEITCTSFGRSLISSADAPAARTTLSVQPTASPTFTGTAIVSGTFQVKANSGSLSHAFGYNENGGEISLYTTSEVQASLIDHVGGTGTRVLELVNGNDLYLGLGSGNTTGNVKIQRAGYVTAVTVSSTGTATFAGQIVGQAGAAISGGTVTVTSPLAITGTVAGNVRSLRMQTSGSTRWEVGPGFDAESGSNVGSTFWITRWSDAGAFLGTPIAIARATGVVTFESQVLVTAGSGSSGSYKPGLSVSGDDDTGVMQVGGANTLSLVTNGTERVRVGSAGRFTFFANSEKYGIQLNNGATANGPFIGSDGADIFTISTAGGAERVRVDASGRVGIGTNLPGQSLHVLGGEFWLTNSNFSLAGGTGSIVTMYTGATTGNTYGGIGALTTGGGVWGDLVLQGGGGRVGIGTTSPPEKLSVFGDNNGGRTSILIDNLDQRLKLSCFYQAGVGQYAEIQSTNNAETGHQNLILNRLGNNVGIGTAIAGTRLSVTGASAAQNGDGFTGIAQFSTGTGAQTDEKLVMGVVDGQYGWIQALKPGTATRAIILNPGGGEVLVSGTTDQGAYNLQCAFTGVWGAGAYVNGSDERIKNDIAPLSSCTDVIESLRPVTFRYKESWSKDQSLQPGFIAQDLQQALAGQPYLDGIVQQGTEYLSVAYQTLIPLLVKALQESNARIAALEERING